MLAYHFSISKSQVVIKTLGHIGSTHESSLEPHTTKTASTRQIHSHDEEFEQCILEDEFYHSIYIDHPKPTPSLVRIFPLTSTHLLIEIPPTSLTLSIIRLLLLAVCTMIHALYGHGPDPTHPSQYHLFAPNFCMNTTDFEIFALTTPSASKITQSYLHHSSNDLRLPTHIA